MKRSVRYLKQFANFRLRAWPFTSSVLHFIEFPSSYAIGELVGFLFDQLYDADRPFVLRTKFTIVNAYCPMTGVSFGLCDAPPEKAIQPNSSLVLTFAVKNSADIEYPEFPPCSLRRLNKNTVFWGTSWLNARDYLTISVPTTAMIGWGFSPALMLNLLRKLYNTLGIVTKNFVLHSKWYESSRHALPDVELSAMNRHASFAKMIKQPFNAWLASENIWLSQSNIFPRFLLKHPSLPPYIFNVLLQDSSFLRKLSLKNPQVHAFLTNKEGPLHVYLWIWFHRLQGILKAQNLLKNPVDPETWEEGWSKKAPFKWYVETRLGTDFGDSDEGHIEAFKSCVNLLNNSGFIDLTIPDLHSFVTNLLQNVSEA